MSSTSDCLEDADYDDSTFPAYTQYINGIDLPYHEPPPSYPMSLPTGPMPYTNSMPSRSMRRGSAVAALPTQSSYPEPTVGVYAQSHVQDGPRVSEVTTLIPPEAMNLTRLPLLANPRVSVKPEPTLFQLPQTPRNYTCAQGSTDRRRMPARQATHPSLLRSFSGTDIDSQAGNMPPSMWPSLNQAGSPTPPCSSAHTTEQVPDRNPPVSQYAVPQKPPFPILKPGELLSNARYASIPEVLLRRFDAQVTSMYNTARNHPDPESRTQVTMKLAAFSAKFHSAMRQNEQMLCRGQPEQEEQDRTRTQVTGSPAAVVKEEHGTPQAPAMPDGFDRMMPSPLHLPHAFAQHHPPPFHQQSSSPQFQNPAASPPSVSVHARAFNDAELQKYIYAGRIITGCEDINKQAAAKAWKQDFEARLSPADRAYLDDAAAQASVRLSSPTPRHTQHQPVQSLGSSYPPHPPQPHVYVQSSAIHSAELVDPDRKEHVDAQLDTV
ncbi:hypothetical protein ACEQ8H_005399 [Pleosporales sp. CAS-2024a]